MSILQNLVNQKTYEKKTINQFGIDIDWFSHVLGRSILCGNITYMSERNFRSKVNLREFKDNNKLNIPITIILLNDETEMSFKQYENLDMFFNLNFNEIEEKFSKCVLFGHLQNASTSGKKIPTFKISRKKEFRLYGKDCLVNIDGSYYFIEKTTFQCNFRGSLK